MITLDAQSNGSQASGSTLTVAHTCSGVNRILVVVVADYSGGLASSFTSVKYNGVAMTQAAAANDANSRGLAIYYLVNPSTGTNNIVLTYTNNLAVGLIASSYNGCDTAGQTNNGISTNGNSTAPSGSITPATAGDVLVDGVNVSNTVTSSPNAGTSLTSPTQQGSSNFYSSYKSPNTTSSYADNWTNSAQAVWGIVAFSIRAIATIPVFSSADQPVQIKKLGVELLPASQLTPVTPNPNTATATTPDTVINRRDTVIGY